MALPEKFYYDNKIVKQFVYATALWGVVGMLAGSMGSPTAGFSCTQFFYGGGNPLEG